MNEVEKDRQEWKEKQEEGDCHFPNFYRKLGNVFANPFELGSECEERSKRFKYNYK